MNDQTRVLLIGGTEEARLVNAVLEELEGVKLVTSLAGRTEIPLELKGLVVRGGFGGADGLAGFLDENKIQWVVDASHPYAAKITQTAASVCRAKEISYIRFQRPPWEATTGDQWISVPTIMEAAAALAEYARVFLSVGRQELEHFADLTDKFFLVRSIEKVIFEPVGSTTLFIQDRGPFKMDDEIKLLQRHQVDVVVSKNSGGAATYAKIVAARTLQLPVIMIDRPIVPKVSTLATIEDVIALFSS
ncbi:MAG: cobalt-precorrin-6A reductase [Sneathiella sp.]